MMQQQMQSIPPGNRYQDSRTSTLELKIREQHPFKRFSIESPPVYAATTDKAQDQQPIRRAMDVRQMQRQTIMARYQDPRPDQNDRFDAGLLPDWRAAQNEASVCETSHQSLYTTHGDYTPQQVCLLKEMSPFHIED